MNYSKDLIFFLYFWDKGSKAGWHVRFKIQMLVKDDNKVLSRRSDDTGEGPDVLTDLLRATVTAKHVKGTSVALSLCNILYIGKKKHLH